MKLYMEQSVLRGRVAIPGSKSHTIRSVAIAALACGTSEIAEPLVSADTMAAAECYRKLGAEIDCGDRHLWQVTGTDGELRVPDDVIDVGNSGTTLRFALGSAALLESGSAVFTGDEQIRQRPAGALLDSLNDLGAQCYSTRGNGMTPIVVKGHLRGGMTSIEAVTSQYLSSLLINVPLASEDTTIEVTKLNEVPYVQITLGYLDEQAIAYENDNMKRFVIKGSQGYRGFNKRIAADFSSATFFLCAGVLLGKGTELVLEGLDFSDRQGDKAVVDMLKAMGGDIEVDESTVVVRSSSLHGCELDLNATPDALPALAVTACFAEGTTRLTNVAQARLKETDRIKVMATELARMGANVVELPDGLEISAAKLGKAELCGYGDHRVVMALSLAGMATAGTTAIDTAEAVNVTFPEYVDLMRNVGAKMCIND